MEVKSLRFFLSLKQSMVKKEGCPFCYIGAVKFPHFERFGVGSLEQYVVDRTDHYVAKVDPLPVTREGHILIFPNHHGIYNFASLNHHAELGKLLYRLEAKFGQGVVLEHGDTGEGTHSIQSVRHSHYHVLFGLDRVDYITYMQDMLNGGLDGITHPYLVVEAPFMSHTLNLEASGVDPNTPYLFASQNGTGLYVPDPNNLMPSMFAQRSAHRFVSGEEMSWKQLDKNDDWAKESIIRLLDFINKCEHEK